MHAWWGIHWDIVLPIYYLHSGLQVSLQKHHENSLKGLTFAHCVLCRPTHWLCLDTHHLECWHTFVSTTCKEWILYFSEIFYPHSSHCKWKHCLNLPSLDNVISRHHSSEILQWTWSCMWKLNINMDVVLILPSITVLFCSKDISGWHTQRDVVKFHSLYIVCPLNSIIAATKGAIVNFFH